MKIHFVWGFCMGAQGAQPPFSAVSGPGRCTSLYISLVIICRKYAGARENDCTAGDSIDYLTVFGCL
jgi:hypothetical protein